MPAYLTSSVGSGYTVEGQKTSEEKHGGLQIEIIPEYDKSLRWWSKENAQQQGSLKDGTPVVFNNIGLLETCTPEELKCHIGDKLRCYPEYPKQRDKRPLNVYDILSGMPENATFKVRKPLSLSSISSLLSSHSSLNHFTFQGTLPSS